MIITFTEIHKDPNGRYITELFESPDLNSVVDIVGWIRNRTESMLQANFAKIPMKPDNIVIGFKGEFKDENAYTNTHTKR